MGNDNNSLIRKCGEISLNIKRNKKTKVYVFNCAFCNTNCDQLKKFSLHLDEKHSQQLSNEPLPLSPQCLDKDENKCEEDIKENLDMFVPEIKVEELMDLEMAPSVSSDIKMEPITNLRPLERTSEDPLETTLLATRRSLRNKSLKTVQKAEHVEKISDSEDGDPGDLNCKVMDYEDSVDGSSSEFGDNIDDNIEEEKISNSRMLSDLSDISSDDARDPDFNINIIRVNTPGKTTKKQDLQEKGITKSILEAFKKQPVLWDIKLRSNEKVIRQNGFRAVAEEVNEKLQLQIKWEDVRSRIRHIRNEYAEEYKKQLKGVKCQMPWYTEHIKFLEENIQALSKNRDNMRKYYRRWNRLDDSHTSILIAYYKNYEVLWQVNDIGFLVKSKRREAIKLIIEDLKVKHRIYVNVHGLQRRLDHINRLYSTDKELQLRCEMNGSIFAPSSKYYGELSFLDESQGPFKCPHCSEIISTYESYHQHVAKHTDSIPFKCTLCEKRFNKLYNYIEHAKYHLGMKNIHCDVCGKIFPYRSKLTLHMQEHTGTEPYLCEICGAGFRQRVGYDNHILRHEKRFRYECQICKAGFNHKDILNTHVKVHLNIRDILCKVCGKGFTAKKYLQRHQLIHSDTKRYKCEICGKAFAQDTGLRAHRKQHIEYRSLSGEARKTAFRKGYYKYDE